MESQFVSIVIVNVSWWHKSLRFATDRHRLMYKDISNHFESATNFFSVTFINLKMHFISQLAGKIRWQAGILMNTFAFGFIRSNSVWLGAYMQRERNRCVYTIEKKCSIRVRLRYFMIMVIDWICRAQQQQQRMRINVAYAKFPANQRITWLTLSLHALK